MKVKGLTRRGKIYWLRIIVKGRLIQRSLGTSSLAEATAKMPRVEGEIALEQKGESLYKETAEKAIADFLAWKRSRDVQSLRITQLKDRLTLAFKVMGCNSPGAVVQPDVLARLEHYDNLSTRRMCLVDMNSFFAWLVSKGRVASNPCAGIEMPPITKKPIRRRFLTPAQAERMLSVECLPDLRFALFCMLHAGLRYGEVCAARPEWFDLKRGILHISADRSWRTKTGTDRSIPLTARFRQFLAENPLSGPYALRPSKKPGKSMYRVVLKNQFEKHLKACGIVCTYHDLRRTFASLHVSAGTPIFHVAKWLGDTVAVTEAHYAHLHHSGDDIERAWRAK